MEAKRIKISSPADYFEALRKIEEAVDALTPEELDAYCTNWNAGTIGTLERAVREYLSNLSPMQRKQIAVHAPDEVLRRDHEWRIEEIDGPYARHGEYLRRLARMSGVLAMPKDAEELKTLAVAGAAMWQQYDNNQQQRIKDQGRIVQCQECARSFHSADTERIKPYGSTRYQRLCKDCAARVKQAKAIYQAANRARRNKA